MPGWVELVDTQDFKNPVASNSCTGSVPSLGTKPDESVRLFVSYTDVITPTGGRYSTENILVVLAV